MIGRNNGDFRELRIVTIAVHDRLFEVWMERSHRGGKKTRAKQDAFVSERQLCVLKTRFCNIGDEGHRGWA